MTCLFDKSLEHGQLICEIILLREKPGHTAILALEWADWRTLGIKLLHIKSTLLKNSLEALRLTRWHCHQLWQPPGCLHWIWLRDYRVILPVLFSTIRFVHVKCPESIWGKRSMCSRLIEDEKCLTIGMSSFKDLNTILNLSKELLCILPQISIETWINDSSSILNDISFTIPQYKLAIFLIYKIGDMD